MNAPYRLRCIWSVAVFPCILAYTLFICTPASADPTYDEARRLAGLNRHAEAIKLLEPPLASARALGHRQAVALFLIALAIDYDALGRFDDALAANKEALGITQAEGTRDMEGLVLSNFTTVYLHIGRYDDALTAGRQAAALFTETHLEYYREIVFVRMGLVYLRLGRTDDALAAYQGVINEARRLGYADREAEAHFFAGETYASVGRNEDAARSQAAALELYRKLGDRHGEAMAMSGIGVILSQTGQLEKAVSAHFTAIDILRQIQDEKDTALVLSRIGTAYLKLGQQNRARDIFLQAMKIDLRVGDPRATARDMANLGHIDDDLGRITRSAYQGAIESDRKAHDRSSEARHLADLAVSEQLMGWNDEALTNAQKSLALARELHERETEARALGVLASLYGHLKRDREAIATYEQALALDRELHDRESEAVHLQNLALVFDRIGSYAVAYQDAAESIRLTAGSRTNESWKTLRTLAHAESKLGGVHEPDATMHYEQALKQIEEAHDALSDEALRASFFEGIGSIYDEYAEHLLALHARDRGNGFDRAAFRVFERKRMGTASRRIMESAARHFSGVPARTVEERESAWHAVSAAWQAYQKSLSDPQMRMADRVAAKNAAEAAAEHGARTDADLKKRYPEYYELIYPTPVDLSALQSVLRPDEVMLIYETLQSHSALFIVTADRFQHVSLAGTDAVSAAVSAVRRRIDSLPGNGTLSPRNDEALTAASRKLYGELLPASVAPLIAGRHHVIVVPSESVYRVPFAMLVSREPQPGQRPHYLIQDVAISYSQSASMYVSVTRSYAGRRQAQHPLIAFANPAVSPGAARANTRSGEMNTAVSALRAAMVQSFGDEAANALFSPLPGAMKEAEDVRLALGAPPQSIISGEAATRHRLLAMDASGELKDYRFILFATHAVLPSEFKNLLRPAIVLAHPERGDGLLTMADILGLSLNADLVVLSGCETGVVERPRGDGISGLTRAFLYAGTPAVAVTLWPIADESAPDLTPRMLSSASRGKSPDEALREAQLSMLSSTDPKLRNPYSWAPYVVFGAGNLRARG